MDKSDKVILVSGASGRQGGAVARHLLKGGWRVRVLTRSATKPAIKELVGLGAEAAEGDFEDEQSLDNALRGCYGAFSVQDFYQSGAEGEVRHGKNFAKSADKAGVEHLVYTSVGSADKKTGIPHFDTKWRIEQYIRDEDIPCTVLRPVFFMDNFWSYQKDAILNGTLSLALPADRKLQMIAVTDIGGVAAACFDEPDKYLNQAVALAGDELTMPETARLIGRTIGRDVRFSRQLIDQVRAQMPELATMYEWFDRVGYSVDIAALRRMYPALLDFGAYARQSEWAQAAQPAAR